MSIFDAQKRIYSEGGGFMVTAVKRVGTPPSGRGKCDVFLSKM